MAYIVGKEQREVPHWIEREIKKIGGYTDGRPIYRLIWGGCRIELMHDKLVNPYTPDHSDASTRKSLAIDRWHLEKLYEGTYEHCYQFGKCPHVTAKSPKWCKDCTLSGGDYVDIPNNFALLERVLHLFVMSEQQRDKVLQHNALMNREKAKEEEGNRLIREAVAAAAPGTIKRSYQPNFKLPAKKILGRSKFKQLTYEEAEKCQQVK